MMTKSPVYVLTIIVGCFTVGLSGDDRRERAGQSKDAEVLGRSSSKGTLLYTPNCGNRGSATIAKANYAMAPHRKAFMMECMKRP
jgi:hypothetical protein